MRRRQALRVVAVVVGAALAVAAAGCGGGGGGARLSKSQYEKKVRAEGEQLKAAFQGISRAPTSIQQVADQFGKAAKQIRTSANHLDALKPPKEIDRDNDDVVKGLRAVAAALEKVKKAAAKNDTQGTQKAIANLQSAPALKRAQRATKDMKDKGYKIGELGT